MSIVKDINVNGKSIDDSASLLMYLIDNLKTDGGKYVVGLGFVTDSYLDEFQSVKIANQKTAGRQFRQITIVPSPAGNNLSKEDYLEIGRKIAQYYYKRGHQVVVTLHLDTNTWHLHLMLNSVNFRTGKMFSQSKSELNRFKLHCNHVFTEYGLDIIRKTADEMVSTVIHEMDEGFDCLELFDEIMADKASNLADLCDDHSESIPTALSTTSIQNSGSPTYSYYFSTSNLTNHSYQKEIYKNYQEVKYMNNTKNNPELPAVSVEQLPSADSTTPGLYVDLGKEVNMTVPKSWSPQQVSEFVNKIDTLPPSEKAYNAKIGDALFADLRRRGIDASVGIGSGVKLNLTFDDIMNSDIIDVPYNEE